MKAQIRIELNELNTNNESDILFDESAAWLCMAALKSEGITRSEIDELTRGIDKRVRWRNPQYLRFSIHELLRKYK